jgi:hypothetical protein
MWSQNLAPELLQRFDKNANSEPHEDLPKERPEDW